MNKQNCSVNFNKESLTRNFLTWVLKELLDQKERLCMCSVAHSCLALCHPMDCSLPASSVHGIFQPRLLEWVSMSYSRGSSQPRDWTRISCVSCIGRQVDSLPPCHLGSPERKVIHNCRRTPTPLRWRSKGVHTVTQDTVPRAVRAGAELPKGTFRTLPALPGAPSDPRLLLALPLQLQERSSVFPLCTSHWLNLTGPRNSKRLGNIVHRFPASYNTGRTLRGEKDA